MSQVQPVRPLQARIQSIVTFKDPNEEPYIIEGAVQFASEEEKAQAVGQTIAMIRAVGGVIKILADGSQYKFIPFSEVKSLDISISDVLIAEAGMVPAGKVTLG
jgi:hypothetical protein